MSREVDLRRPLDEPDEQRLRSLAQEVSTRLPGAQTARLAATDALTGNAARVESLRATAAPGSYPARALAHLRTVSPLLGLTGTQPVEFVPDPVVQTSSSGAHTVHLRQQHQGITVFQAAQAVVFDPSDAISSTAGSSVTIEETLDPNPSVRVEDAVRTAARHVARPTADELNRFDQFMEPIEPPTADLDGFEPHVTALLPGTPDRSAVLDAGPFAEPITAGLVWFPVGPGDTRLGWHVVLTMPGHAERFAVVVDANDRTVLFARQMVVSVAAGGDVFLIDGGQERRRIPFPRNLEDYRLDRPAGLPAGFPDPWLARDTTDGTNAIAHPGDTGPHAQGRRDGDELTFTFAADSVEQQVLNAFALVSSAHDFFYLLGFTEADANFQRDSLGRGGVATDPVDARVFGEPVSGTASMATPVDGASPVLRLGPVRRTGRHTALDATIVFHEYTHGVTNRLIGGGLDTHALDEIQSGGMGEGWGDYFGCLYAGTNVVGRWAVDRANGIRGNPYDEHHPGHFGKLGIDYTEVHEVGEVWCATLMEMTRRLGSEQLAMHLVLDALKLSRANPSFLDMRDAILRALTDMRSTGRLSATEFGAAERAVWGAFARFGMGPRARCPGARLDGIVADFEPPQPRPQPVAAQPAHAPIYGVTVVLDADGEVRDQHVVQADGPPAGPQVAPAGSDGGRRIQYFVETHAGGPAETTAPAPADCQVGILDMHFGTADRHPPATADRPGHLTAAITFALTGADAARLADDQALYLAHIVVTSADPAWTRVIATATGHLSPGTPGAEVTLDFDAPEPGRYQLLGGVIVAPCEALGVEAGPSLRVVP
ncbi:M36 family metallopeptidase [Actinoplanes sp. N902-109]|uniref:M36 family metallopeptidase n=1 Tax=Actinoplanes sp. (strain N902-109) TaxID=649831 RepID=UPI0003294213|nr:M36 family metallopeptidase [Actinoplanes sp. N902-109]AGL17007.1 metalloprotease [Actinoplanes sp. N902-109]